MKDSLAGLGVIFFFLSLIGIGAGIITLILSIFIKKGTARVGGILLAIGSLLLLTSFTLCSQSF